MAVQLTLLDGDTGGKRSSLELLAGGVVGLPNGLPAGTYLYQPLVWDTVSGAWVPASFKVAAQIHGSEAGGSTVLAGDVNATVRCGVGGLSRLEATESSVECASSLVTVAANSPTSFPSAQVICDGSTDTVTVRCASGSIKVLEMSAAGATAKIGFLGATAVARPDLTASLASPQAQIDDIVAALVSLGLVTDNRVP